MRDAELCPNTKIKQNSFVRSSAVLRVGAQHPPGAEAVHSQRCISPNISSRHHAGGALLPLQMREESQALPPCLRCLTALGIGSQRSLVFAWCLYHRELSAYFTTCVSTPSIALLLFFFTSCVGFGNVHAVLS